MTRTNKIVLGIVIIAMVGVAIATVAAVVVINRFSEYVPILNHTHMFADQLLKTAVAQIELHKLRYGTYPEKLEDLKFLGAWDRGILVHVAYYPNEAQTAYYVEIRTALYDAADVNFSEEFWRGTGFSPALRPSNNVGTQSPTPN